MTKATFSAAATVYSVKTAAVSTTTSTTPSITLSGLVPVVRKENVHFAATVGLQGKSPASTSHARTGRCALQKLVC